MGPRQLNVFLSYPSEQLEQAREIYSFLRSIGINGWFDKESLIGGQNWERERAAAQKVADLTLIVCSPETLGRQGVVQRELKDALKRCRDVPLGHICLVPLRTEELNLPDELREYHYVDLFRPGWQFNLARSIDFKFKLSKLEQPQALIEFIESAGSVARRTLNCADTSFEWTVDYFQYKKPGLYWNYVNSEVTSVAAGGFIGSRFDRHRFLIRDDWKGSWSLRIDEHFSAGELVSLKCFEFADYIGAHPTRGIHTRNYDGSAGGRLKLEELFGSNEVVFAYLKQYCERDVNSAIRCRFDRWEPKVSSRVSRQRLISLQFPLTLNFDDYTRFGKWKVFSQWNFSSSGLSIALSQFSGLPFAMGVHEVLIPWEFFRDKISEDFRETSIGRLIDRS